MLLPLTKAIILGLVEGLTEFLPISSTGHLILVNQWLSFDKQFTASFDIVIQLGAILAVIVYFWPRLWPFVPDQTQRKMILNTWSKTIIGFLPAIIIGALLAKTIENKLFNPLVVANALLIGGIVLIIIEKKQPASRFNTLAELPLTAAFYIGLIQCLSLIPGTSRAAATIVGALLLGASRTVAVEFSFFLAIPTMVAAATYSLFKHGLAMTASELIILATGFITAFASALIVIKFFINFIQRRNLIPFGYYRVILAIVIFILFLLK